MSAVRSPVGGRTVFVRLSDVPLAKRLAAADRMIRVGGLSGTPAIDLKMAAAVPRQDPGLKVPEEQARRVLGRAV